MYFSELAVWAFFLKEKTLVLKREAAGFAEIPAENTSESALALLSKAGKKHTIWVAPEKGCIEEFNRNFGKSNKGQDGDFMYHGEANFALSVPEEKIFDLLKCMDEVGYLFTTSAWSGFSGSELWIMEKAK